MNEDKDKEFLGGLMTLEETVYAVGILIFGLIVYLMIDSNKQDKDMAETLEAIEKRRNGRDVIDVNTIVSTDINFDAKPYVERLLAAHGYFYDDDETVFGILCNNLNQSQIKKVSDEMKRQTTKDLQTWLKDDMFASFVDNGKYAKAMQCISQATA